MLKNRDITLTKKISLHIGQEPLCYLIPTIGVQKLDWRKITQNNYVTYLFAIKWLNMSCGLVIKKLKP
jgi:hypothetical protein